MTAQPDAGIVVDPEMAAILARLAEEDGDLPDPTLLPIAEGREQFRRVHRRWNVPLPAMARVETLAVPAEHGAMPARLVAPDDADGAAILFVHGGGWTFGDLDTYDRAARLLAQASRSAVVTFEYRLAPEHPFPAPLHDTAGALRWLRSDAPALGLDPHRLAVAGDSAGANLALAAMLMLRDAGEPLPRAGGLFYGVYSHRFDTPSHRRNGDGRFGLSSTRMARYWANYVGPDGDRQGPLAAPLDADLAGLPPLAINGAGLDPLLDDTDDLCARLDRAGARYACAVYPGVVHGFMMMTADLAIARQAMNAAGAALKALLSND